jgi:hypothetical protein
MASYRESRLCTFGLSHKSVLVTKSGSNPCPVEITRSRTCCYQSHVIYASVLSSWPYQATPLTLAFDTVRAETAAWCQIVLINGQNRSSSSKAHDPTDRCLFTKPPSHLVGLVGSPKELVPNVRIHQVPIKLFHTNQDIGRVLSSWPSIPDLSTSNLINFRVST